MCACLLIATSRTRKAAEVDGMDYDFMSKAMMLEAIQHNQFVEFGGEQLI